MKPYGTITATLSHFNVRPAIALLVLTALLAGCAQVAPKPTPQPTMPAPEPARTAQQSNPMPALELEPAQDEIAVDAHGRTGMASYYGQRFAGNRTASGEIFHPSELTAAHRSLPFGTRVRVTNLKNGEQIVVRINDRGPFVDSRIIDVSRGAAERLGMIQTGVVPVRLQVLN